MANVLLTWELGGGAGHCTKLAVLANGLIDHGHDVCIAARELDTARRVFGSNGVRLFQAPFVTARPSNPIHQTRSLAHILHNNGFANSEGLDALCGAWRNLFVAVKPHILICDHAPVALLASYWRPMRRVLIGTGFTVPPDVTPFPDLRYWDVGAESDLRRDEELICGRVNELLARNGLNQLDTLTQLYSRADERYLLTFRELDHYPRREEATYWGAWSMSGGLFPEWPSGKNRIFAYVKPPTANWPLFEFLSALRESQLPTIVYIGGSDSRSFEKFQSAQLRIASHHLDIARVAMQCDLAILHGTSGSATAFLLAGVPQLNMPLFLEQLILSRRIADLGAGLYTDPARPKEAVSRVFEMLQTDRYRCAAQDFAHRYTTYDPQRTAGHIVSRIQKLLSN